MGSKTLVIVVITLICVCQTLAGKYDLSDGMFEKLLESRSKRAGSPGMPGNAMPGLPGPRAPASSAVPYSVGVPVLPVQAPVPVVTQDSKSNDDDGAPPILVKDSRGKTWLVVLISQTLADPDE